MDEGIEAIPDEELDIFGVSASHPARNRARPPAAFAEVKATFAGKLFAFPWREERVELDPNGNESSISLVISFGEEVTSGYIGKILLYSPANEQTTSYHAQAEIMLSRTLFGPLSLIFTKNVGFYPQLHWEYDDKTEGPPRMVGSVKRVELAPSRLLAAGERLTRRSFEDA